jgi:hypothetical protein
VKRSLRSCLYHAAVLGEGELAAMLQLVRLFTLWSSTGTTPPLWSSVVRTGMHGTVARQRARMRTPMMRFPAQMYTGGSMCSAAVQAPTSVMLGWSTAPAGMLAGDDPGVLSTRRSQPHLEGTADSSIMTIFSGMPMCLRNDSETDLNARGVAAVAHVGE